MCCVNPAPPHSRMSLEGFTIGDVVHIKHIREGEDDGADWICIGQLKDGRWFNLEAGVITTRSVVYYVDARVVVADDYETLMRLGCNRETRSLFGWSI